MSGRRATVEARNKRVFILTNTAHGISVRWLKSPPKYCNHYRYSSSRGVQPKALPTHWYVKKFFSHRLNNDAVSPGYRKRAGSHFGPSGSPSACRCCGDIPGHPSSSHTGRVHPGCGKLASLDREQALVRGSLDRSHNADCDASAYSVVIHAFEH